MVKEEFELATDAIDLFSLPSLEKSLICGRQQTYYPVGGTLSEEGPWEIIIPNESHEFIDLRSISLYGELTVKKYATGNTVAEIGDTDNVSDCNNLPQSLFTQADIYLNQTCVNDLATSNYHYKGYIENHYTYGDSVKKTTLRGTEGYIKDVAGHESDWDLADVNGWRDRKSLIAGKTFCFNMKIHNDFLMSTRYLLPGVELKIRLTKNVPGFSLMTKDKTASYQFRITKLEVRLRKITVEPAYIAAIENLLGKSPALYPIAHSKIRSYLLPKDTKNINIPNILRGRLPRSFIIFFVDNEAYAGNITRNPYVFKHFNLEHFNVYINGEPVHQNALRLDWESGSIIDQYKWMLDNIGLHDYISNGITLEDFKNNSVCFPYDLTPDLCNSYKSHGTESGNVDITLGFKTGLQQAVQMLIYATYDEVVTIDKLRVVNLISNNSV